METVNDTSIFTFVRMNNVDGVEDCIERGVELNCDINGNLIQNFKLENSPLYEALCQRWILLKEQPLNEVIISDNMRIIQLLLLNNSNVNVWFSSTEYDFYSCDDDINYVFNCSDYDYVDEQGEGGNNWIDFLDYCHSSIKINDFTRSRLEDDNIDNDWVCIDNNYSKMKVFTLLCLAIDHEDIEIIILLLNYGANPNLPVYSITRDNYTNETISFSNGHIESNCKLTSTSCPLLKAILLSNLGIVQCLINYGVDLTDKTITTESMYLDNFNIFSYFLENNILNMKNPMIKFCLRCNVRQHKLETLMYQQIVILSYLFNKIKFKRLKKRLHRAHGISTYFLSMLKVNNERQRHSLITLYSQKLYQENHDESFLYREMVLIFIESLSEQTSNNSFVKYVNTEYLQREICQYICL